MRKLTIISLLCVIGLVSCTDWQATYKTKLEEAARPVIDKYYFIKNVYDGAKEENTDCKTYDDVNEMDIVTALTIFAALPKEESDSITSIPLSNLSKVLFVHFPANDGHNLKDDISDMVSEDDTNIKSYQHYVNKIVNNRREVKNTLEYFDTFFVEKIKSTNYLIIAKDKILFKPKKNRRRILTKDVFYAN